MTLVLRRIIWPDGESRRNDYNVIHEDSTVGRIHRLNSVETETWQWTQVGARAPTYGPNGGVTDSLQEAMAAFRRAWDAHG